MDPLHLVATRVARNLLETTSIAYHVHWQNQLYVKGRIASCYWLRAVKQQTLLVPEKWLLGDYLLLYLALDRTLVKVPVRALKERLRLEKPVSSATGEAQWLLTRQVLQDAEAKSETVSEGQLLWHARGE